MPWSSFVLPVPCFFLFIVLFDLVLVGISVYLSASSSNVSALLLDVLPRRFVLPLIFPHGQLKLNNPDLDSCIPKSLPSVPLTTNCRRGSHD